MDNLIKCILAQKVEGDGQALNEEIDRLIIHPQMMNINKMTTTTKLLALPNINKYIDIQQQSLLIQLIIKGLTNKIVNQEVIQFIMQIFENKSISDKSHIVSLHFMSLISLYRLRKQSNDQNTQQQQLVNKWINTLESASALQVQQFINCEWNSNIITIITKAITKNSVLFRNQQKQLMEHCIAKLNAGMLQQECAQLFSILLWTNLEGKQANSSYQTQLATVLTQIYDALYILSTLLLLDSDNLTLYDKWQANVINEEFKQNITLIFQQHRLLQDNYHNNSQIKYSVLFQLIKPILHTLFTNNYHDADILKEQYMNCQSNLIMLLKHICSNIRDQVVIELQITEILDRISETLHINQSYNEFITTKINQQVSQQILNKLSKLTIERKFQFTIESYKNTILQVFSNSFNSIKLMIQSPFSQSIVQNSGQINKILQNIINIQFIFNSDVLLEISNLITVMQQEGFFQLRVSLRLQKILVDKLESVIPKFVKDMTAYLKQERLQISRAITDTKSKKTNQKQAQKVFSLGISESYVIEREQILQAQQFIEIYFKVLYFQLKSNVQYKFDQEILNQFYQFSFVLFSFPGEHLIQSISNNTLDWLLKICITITQNYTHNDNCVIQPMQVYAQHLLAKSQVNDKTRKLASRLISNINILRYRVRSTIIDNFQSTMKSLNDQYNKAQVILSSGSDQFQSCRENMEVTDNHQEVIQQIKKTRSLMIDDNSNIDNNHNSNIDNNQLIKKDTLQSDEIFYSIANLTNKDMNESKKEGLDNMYVSIQSKDIGINQNMNVINEVDDDDDVEMPKAVFD